MGLEQLQRVMHEQSQLHAKLPEQLMRLAQHVMLQRQLLQHLLALLHAYTEDLLREASQLASHEMPQQPIAVSLPRAATLQLEAAANRQHAQPGTPTSLVLP